VRRHHFEAKDGTKRRAGGDLLSMNGGIMTDLAGQLKKILDDTGEVNALYGGFEVRVDDPTRFPWYKILNLLIEIGHEIWVSKKENTIHITSKPKV
jgi:hypothetical protein